MSVSTRTKARRAALDLLFEAHSRSLNPVELLQQRIAAPVSDAPIRDHTKTLVEGVSANAERIDELLTTYSQGWSIERMPGVDREALRIATYEILYQHDVPAAVAIDEAVNIVAELSTDDSPGFVSGLLNRIKDLPQSAID
jgi:N utilization substance protein B